MSFACHETMFEHLLNRRLLLCHHNGNFGQYGEPFSLIGIEHCEISYVSQIGVSMRIMEVGLQRKKGLTNTSTANHDVPDYVGE
jgi:hypothetical protein